MYEELISAHPCQHLLFVIVIIALPVSGILCFWFFFCILCFICISLVTYDGEGNGTPL